MARLSERDWGFNCPFMSLQSHYRDVLDPGKAQWSQSLRVDTQGTASEWWRVRVRAVHLWLMPLPWECFECWLRSSEVCDAHENDISFPIVSAAFPLMLQIPSRAPEEKKGLFWPMVKGQSLSQWGNHNSGSWRSHFHLSQEAERDTCWYSAPNANPWNLSSTSRIFSVLHWIPSKVP